MICTTSRDHSNRSEQIYGKIVDGSLRGNNLRVSSAITARVPVSWFISHSLRARKRTKEVLKSLVGQKVSFTTCVKSFLISIFDCSRSKRVQRELRNTCLHLFLLESPSYNLREGLYPNRRHRTIGLTEEFLLNL